MLRQRGWSAHAQERWMVTLLVASLVSFVALHTTTAVSARWTGPSFTVMASLSAVVLFTIFAHACAIACCCKVPKRPLAWACCGYVVVGLLGIIVWPSSIDAVVEYSCEASVDCDEWRALLCGNHDAYVYCKKPQARRKGKGDFVASRWVDPDCDADKGGKGWCRAWTSEKKCRKFENPRVEKEGCYAGKHTVREEATTIAVIYIVFTLVALVGTVGFAVAVLSTPENRRRVYNHGTVVVEARQEPIIVHPVVELRPATQDPIIVHPTILEPSSGGEGVEPTAKPLDNNNHHHH